MGVAFCIVMTGLPNAISRPIVLLAILLWALGARAEHYSLPLLVPAGTSTEPQGVLRILNGTAESSTVEIYAIDDSGARSGPATFTLNASAAVEFTATDLQSGNATMGLTGGIGTDVGDARLEIEADLDIVPLAFVRAADGTLSAMHDTVRSAATGESDGYTFEVPVFNPSTEMTQVSRLRLINPGDAAAAVTISGRDDSAAEATGGDVTLTLAAGGSKTLTAQQLEAGDTDVTGQFGAGTGKWRLTVSSDQPLQVVNIVASTAGYWNNLSTTAVAGAAPADQAGLNERFVGNSVVYETSTGRFTLNAVDGNRFTETDESDGVTTTNMGAYSYTAIGPDAGQLTLDYDDGDVCRTNLYFSSRTSGWFASNCIGSDYPADGTWLGGSWSEEPDEDDRGEVADTTYAVSDMLPGVPTSGSFVPSRTGGGSEISATADGATIALNENAYFELSDGTRYTCTSADGCTVVNGTVTRGTIAGRASGSDGGEVDQFPTFRTAVAPGDQTYTAGTAIDTLTLPEAIGGNAPLTYSLAPNVPGLTFNATMRQLTGTPSTLGSYAMTYTVTDEDGDSDALRFTIGVTEETGSLGVCYVGLLVGIGQSCTYPGTTDAFSVNVRGRGSFLTFLAGIRIRINNETIDGRVYDFESSHQGDGVWRIDRIAGSPDLTVGSPSVSDSSPETGGSFTLSVTVRNAGDGASAATTLRYYRSTDATISSSDTAVGTDAVGALASSGTSAESIGLTAPATAGTYYYGACVDSLTGESSTANNCSTSVQVDVEERESPTSPDLVVGTPTVSDSSPETGDSFTLSATVRNAGDGSSAATTLRYYRSTDATISSSDTAVGTDAVGALASSGTSAESIGLTAPATAGTYYYGACVDSLTGESSTANNCSTSVQVDVEERESPTSPDLVVGTPTVSDSSPETGDSFTLSATVRNAGDGSSAATTLRYYRSTDATISSSDTAVGTDAVGALASSGTSAESIGLTAPATAGTYYYGACVDSLTGESSTANNCSTSVQVDVEERESPTSPDLVVGTPTVSDSSPETGDSFTLSVTVRNAGDGASAATTLRYYRSTDATISSSDTAVGTDAVGALASSGTSAESIGLTAPATAGTYYYGACVDSVTGESDTGNNCSASVEVDVEERESPTSPDLVVGTPTVSDSSPETGDSFTLSATVRNAGDGSSAATTLRYYRSTDATISSSDTAVGTDAVGALASSGTSAESIGLTAPATAGTYYYGACVDSVTGESDTTNNCSGSVQVTVSTAPPGPDLKVYAFSVSISPFGTGPGELIQAGAGVENEGDESSPATTVRFYQSTDATITTADTQVGTDTVAALSAGATIGALGADVTAPSSGGTYYYGACVDAVTGESDTTNNCSMSIPVTVSE